MRVCGCGWVGVGAWAKRERERELWEISWRPDYTSELQATQRERKKRPSLSTWYFKRAAGNLVTKVQAVMRLCITIATVATRSLGKISLGRRFATPICSSAWFISEIIEFISTELVLGYTQNADGKKWLWIQRTQIYPIPYIQLNSNATVFL